jgi:hypothetical protein
MNPLEKAISFSFDQSTVEITGEDILADLLYPQPSPR